MVRPLRLVRVLSWRIGHALPFALLLVVIIWAGVFQANQLFEASKQREAEQDAANFARVFEDHVARAIRETDKTLLFLRAVYESNPNSFDLLKWTNDSEFKSELVIQYALIDPRGLMVDSNVGKSKQRLDLSDREHFRAHLGAAPDKLFISEPVLGRASGKWSIQLSRRIRGVDGALAGVLVGSIDPAFLTRFYNGIDLGVSGAATLAGLDGIIRARSGLSSEVLGKHMGYSRVFDLAKSQQHGTFMEKDVLDSVPRLVGFRVVTGLPLIVLAGISDEEILNQSRLSKNIAILAGACLTVLVGLLITSMHLKSRLNAKMAALSIEKDRSEAANAAKSSFLAVMSHEIRTPMNAILGLSSSLMTRNLPSHEHGLVKLINEEGDRLLILLNDILDYSKMDSGKLLFEHISFAPHEITSSVIDLAEPRATAKGLTIGTYEAPGLPTALIGDAGRLRQVLLNLVSNSIKFTASGSVTVRVECVGRGDGWALIKWTVADTGIGIEAGNISKLFGDFVQADLSITRSFGGSGLGLSICRRIILQMGGNIDIQSVPGVGTAVNFVVKLPIGIAAPVSSLGSNHSEESFAAYVAARGEKVRLLVVDDSQVNRLVAAEMFQEFDVAIDVAGDGIEAVTAASNFRYDLILMDMQMPEMDGITATRTLRAQSGWNSAVPIVAFTANAFQEDVARCKEAGMSGFITKPVRRNIMLDEIVRVLCCRASPSEPITSPLPAPAPAPAPAGPLVDAAMLASFVRDRPAARALKTVEIFAAELEEKRSGLTAIIDHPSQLEMERLTHSVIGSASLLGAQRLVELSRKLEHECRNHQLFNLTAANELLAVMSQTIDLFKAVKSEASLQAMMDGIH